MRAFSTAGKSGIFTFGTRSRKEGESPNPLAPKLLIHNNLPKPRAAIGEHEV